MPDFHEVYCAADITRDIADADGTPLTDFAATCTRPRGHFVAGSDPHVGVSQGYRLVWEPGIVHSATPL